MTRIERAFPGHFICADRCRYRRCTDVNGKWRVSTIGAMSSGDGTGELGMIGSQRYFETMVFPLGTVIDTDSKAPLVSDWGGLDMAGYQTWTEADAGHEAMVNRWSAIQSFTVTA